MGLNNEFQPTTSNRIEQQLQQLSQGFPSDVICDLNMKSSSVNYHNQSSPTVDTIPPCHLPEHINRCIPKPIYEADLKCKHSLRSLDKKA
ncbi:hypothetical protein SADUNF_Sadunf05G0134000 [Salix dunnii]|uniref:Uncharacterized protein n=1 Tax=Salix dunnii TaxID=1413687 RepID=A0A835KB37_9ROSI|nr:hypothetical protein SADUNF_Sadunf05G0134000 [Salix dunnii]